MMEPTDGSSVQAKTALPPRRQSHGNDDHDIRSIEFLSMLPPPADASTEEMCADDDDSSTATSLSLNTGSRRSRRIGLQHLSLDGPDVLGEARRMVATNYIYWMQEATTSPTNVELTYHRKNSECLTTKEQPTSLMDWVLQQQASNPYCVDFNLWDDHRSSTAGSTVEKAEEREEALQHADNTEPPRDNDEKPIANDENDSPDCGVDTVASSNTREGVVVVISTEKGQRRFSLGRVPLTTTQQTNKGGSCGSSDLTSSVCDSIALTSYCGGDDWDEDDAFLEKVVGRRHSPQTIVTNRNAWRSAFASGGGVPSIRVYADPRDLYSNRQNVVARQCWW